MNPTEEKYVEDLKQQIVVLEKRLSSTQAKLIGSYEELKNQFLKASKPKGLLSKIKQWYLAHISWLVIPSLLGGVFGAKFFPPLLDVALPIVDGFINGLLVLAPFAIFIILAPTVTKLIKTRGESRFAGFVVIWFTLSRILACLIAIILAYLALGLPLAGQEASGGVLSLLGQNLSKLLGMLTTNIFIQATVAAIVVGIIGHYISRLHRLLERGAQAVESLGEYIEPVIPLFMFLLGAFIFGLPISLSEKLDPATLSHLAKEIHLFGFSINLRGELGLMMVYAVESALIILACFIWQGISLFCLRWYLGEFSLRNFITKYWIKVYPLAWSTSSEKLAMPLNISTLKKQYPHVGESMRRLVLGLGSFLNQNGTSMDVILLTAICGLAVGYPPSLLTLLLAIPLIVIIGYGVPGIPGEQVVYAIPILTLMAIPQGPLSEAFLAIFVAIQLGLPDSFRSATNVTDNGIYALWLNKIYQKKYGDKK